MQDMKGKDKTSWYYAPTPEMNKWFHKRVQSDWHLMRDEYGEGRCFSCERIDQVFITIMKVCLKCIKAKAERKRGKYGLSGIMNHKPCRRLWCDSCLNWPKHSPKEYRWQGAEVTCRVCERCLTRIEKAWLKSGEMRAIRTAKKIYGKDYQKILGIDDETIAGYFGG